MSIRLPQRLIMIGLLCLCAWGISAQDDPTPVPPTATPQGPNFIYTWSAEVYYPALVRFSVIVDRPVETITTVALSLQVPGQETQLLEFNPQDLAIFSDGFTELVYILELTPENVFPFDSLVEYTWLMTTSQDGAGGFSGAFEFTDPRTTWTHHADPEAQINFYLPDDTPNLSTNDIWAVTRDVYDLLAQHTGQSPTFDLTVLTSDEFPLNPCELNNEQIPTIIELQSELEFTCHDNVIQASIQQLGTTIIEVDSNRNLSIILSDYLFRQFYSAFWQNESIPDWFKEGIRQFYRSNIKSGLLQPLRTAGRNNQLFTLNELQDFGIAEETNQNILQSQQSFGMVLYIADQIGYDNLIDFVTQLNVSTLDTPFTTLYETYVGQSLDGLLINFDNWLFTENAEADFDTSPYQDPTPQPSITPTNTPFPPTPSDTPTATATFTPTATVTGFLTVTPLPSLTPTPTRRPQEPTNTPRSALSVQQAQQNNQDEDNSDSTSNDDPFSLLGILLIAGGIIALGVISAITFRNNQGNKS